mgnify:CR=1 FL=1
MDEIGDIITLGEERNHAHNLENAKVDALGRVVISTLICSVLGWLWYGAAKHLIWGTTKAEIFWPVAIIACLALFLMSVKALTSLYIGCAGFLNPALYAAWQERRANQKALDQDLALQDAQRHIDEREAREARVLSKAWTMREQERMDKARALATPKPTYRRCLPKNPRMRKRR